MREDTPARREGARETQSVQSLERGLAVLQVFSRENPAPTLSEVARLAGTTRATARRILLTLERLGHVRSDGRRFSLTVGYKAASSEQIGFHVWQATRNRPWHLVLEHATPEQLECLGIPKPGHAFWTRRTLELTQARWPGWDRRASR